jgi:polar amino acid transport system substrate-binding protein
MGLRSAFAAIAMAATAGITGVTIGLAPAAAADLLQTIKDKGKIVIGTEARYPPFEFVEDGKIVGYGPDLFEVVAKALPGVKVERLDLPFQGLLPGLQAKKFDAIITAVTATKRRFDTYRLTLPIADATLAVVKRKGDTRINKAEDLAGKIVGTQAGSGQLAGTELFSKQLADKGGKAIQRIETYVDFNEAYADLAAGRVDAVVNSLPNLLHLQKQRPEVFEVVQPTFGPKAYFSWVVRKDDDSASLGKLVDEQLRKLNQDGTMKALQQKWFGFAMELPSDTLPTPEN